MFAGSRNSQLHRLRALTAAALLLAVALLAKYGHQPDTATLQILHHALTSPVGTDSTFYMEMGEKGFGSSSHLIYRDLFFAKHQKFIYPPSSLFLLQTLNGATHMHVSMGTVLMALLLVSWVGTLLAAVCLYSIERGFFSTAETACVVVLGVLFLPIAEALYRGQVQLLLTCLWGFAVLLWIREKPGWSAFALALTCAFKPQLAVFLLWGVLRKQWRFTIVLATTLALMATCSIGYYGLRNNLDYFAVLNYLGRHGEALWANQSFNGLMNRLLRNGDAMSWNPTVYPPYRPIVYAVSTALSLLVLFSALLLPMRTAWRSTGRDFLLLGCASVLVSPIAWEHHYGYFFFLIVFLLVRVETISAARWVVLSVCTLAMANRLPPLDHRMSGGISLISSYVLYSGLVLLGLLGMEGQRSHTELVGE